MRWMTRINSILSANIHDALDRCEDPRKQLDQAVREMEASLHRTVQRAVRVLAEEKLLAKRTAECKARTASWQKRAEQAVQDGDDAGARSALARKLESARLHESLQEQLDQLRASSATLRQQISEMRESLRNAKAKKATLVAKYTAAQVKQDVLKQCEHVEQDDGAFATFQRMAERIEQREAEADALAELTREGAIQCPAVSADDLAIEAELASLKVTLSEVSNQ